MSHDASVEQQILATIDKWVEQELRPIAREFDQADEYPSDLVEQMKELGLFGATISEEYGAWVSAPRPMLGSSRGFARSGWRPQASSIHI